MSCSQTEMDDLLPMLLSFPVHPHPLQPLSDKQYDESIKLQVENVRKLSSKRLLQSTSGGENILDIINPTLNSIPYALALLAHAKDVQNAINATNNTGQSTNTRLALLWPKMVTFLETFDVRQVRYIGLETREIISALAAFARHLKEPESAITPITNAILRLDPTASTLTSAHLILCQLALESGAYAHAAPVLGRYVLHLPGANSMPEPKYACSLHLAAHQYITIESGLTTKVNTQEVLEYFLFSGAVFIGLEQWERAAELLESVVTYPVKDNAISKIMVEAYKKWILVKVLLGGKSPTLPRNTNSNASKAFQVIGKPYAVVASLFEMGSASRLNSEIIVGTEIWRKDGNDGLMRAILLAYQKHQIRRLSSLYKTISVSYISQSTASAETGTNLSNDEAVEVLINEMISQGELHGALMRPLDQFSFLGFNPGGPVLTESRVELELIDAMERIRYMMEDIKTTDRILTHEKDYLRWAHKQTKPGDGNSGDGYVGEELGWSIGPDDEDLMAG